MSRLESSFYGLELGLGIGFLNEMRLGFVSFAKYWTWI